MSRRRRFYVPELEPENTRGSVSLPPDEAHHAIDVLRLVPGAEVELFDGRGRALRGSIQTIDGDDVVVETVEEAPSPESPLDLTMALAVPKSDRMDVAVQKLTELGVTRIVPLVTERSVVRGRLDKRLLRWRRVVLEATKQCGRNRLAELTGEQTIEAFVEAASTKAVSIWVAEPLAPTLDSETLSASERKTIAVLIGPEGGLTEEERVFAQERGARAFGLGPRVLRTETAAIAAATLFQAALGDG